MRLVIEEITRNKKVLRYHTFDVSSNSSAQIDTTKKIRIGRAYDNDIILNEVHVSPYHAEIVPDEEGCWYIVDCNSLNAVRDEKGHRVNTQRPLISGDIIVLGRCQLRIWDARHPVEHTWPLHRAEDIFYRLGKKRMIVALLPALIFITAFFATFEEEKAEGWFSQIPSMLITGLLLMLWASAWSLVGRIVKQESRFYAQLAVTMLAFIAIQPLEWFSRVLAFNVGIDLWLDIVQLFFFALVATLLLWSHLFLSIPQHPKYRVLISVGLIWSLTALKVAPEFSEKEHYRAPHYPNLVIPPIVNWTQGVDESAFIQDIEALYTAHPSDEKGTKTKETKEQDTIRTGH